MSVFFKRRGAVPEKIPELLDSFSDNSWSDIIWACQTKNVPDTWTVGSQKAMTIKNIDYQIDIIGLNHDEYADGSGKAPITFQMHDCYNTKYLVNPSYNNTNVGGWASCSMRNEVLPALLGQMPEEAQAAIREINKLTSVGNQSATIETTADKLFLLSEIEVFGKCTYSKNGEGNQYEYYSKNSAVKYINGSVTSWWERSPHSTSNIDFCCVYQGGASSTDLASSTLGVAFAFCF